MEYIASKMAFMTAALDYIARTTPIFLAFSALLAYYYREKIKSILARSLAREIEELKSKFAIEIAEHQARLGRELEAYKVSLIAETEKIKAAQDVKKSIAIKFSERRFQAIASMLDVHMGLDTDIGSLLTSEDGDPDFYTAEKKRIIERLKNYTKTFDSAVLFISPELRKHALDFRMASWDSLKSRETSSDPKLKNDTPEIQKLMAISVELERELKQAISNFENFLPTP